MKGKLKKWMSVTLAASMIFALGGCGNSDSNSGSISEEVNSSTSESAVDTTNDGYIVGYTLWGSGSYSLNTLRQNAQYAVEGLGGDFTYLDDEFTVEKTKEDVQNMISSGADAIMLFSVSDSLYEPIMEVCEKAQVPLVLFDKVPESEEVIDSLRECEYFVGGISENNYQAGYDMGSKAAEDGMTTALIVSSEIGDATGDGRTQGFTDAFEAAGGTVVDVLNTSTNDATTKFEDLLVANTDVDCVYANGGDFSIAAMTVLNKYPNYNIALYATDLNDEIFNGVDSGLVAAVNGTRWITCEFAAVLLSRYMSGNPILDNNNQAPIISDVTPIMVTKEQESLYQKFFVENQPYTVAELEKFASADTTYDELVSAISEYSFAERMTARMNEGLVTEEELIEADIIK
jgi:ribose transport system substrate-binding protein